MVLRTHPHPLQELLRTYSGARVDAELHLRDFPVNLLHEVDDKVDEFVPVHLIRVEVGDEEADVIVLQHNGSGKKYQLASSQGAIQLRSCHQVVR